MYEYDDKPDFLYSYSKPQILQWLYDRVNFTEKEKEDIEAYDIDDLRDYVEFNYFL